MDTRRVDGSVATGGMSGVGKGVRSVDLRGTGGGGICWLDKRGVGVVGVIK